MGAVLRKRSSHDTTTMDPTSTGAITKSREPPDMTPTSATALAGGWIDHVIFVRKVVVYTGVAITVHPHSVRS